jgi:hypothetical protein
LLIKEVALGPVLEKTARFLGCDLNEFKSAARISSNRVLDRDLLLYAVWQLGVQTNSLLAAAPKCIKTAGIKMQGFFIEAVCGSRGQ